MKKWIWFLCGILSVLALAFAPCMKWYVLGQTAVMAGFVYCYILAQKRHNLVVRNKEVLAKMSRKQKEQFWQNDQKECRMIYSMAFRLFQVVMFFVIAFNIYCCFYAYKIGPDAVFDQQGWTMSWIMIGISAVLLVVFDALGLKLIREDLVDQSTGR